MLFIVPSFYERIGFGQDGTDVVDAAPANIKIFLIIQPVRGRLGSRKLARQRVL